MRASTTLTTWIEETEAKSSCIGSLRDRGGGRHQKKDLGPLTLLVFIPEGGGREVGGPCFLSWNPWNRC